MVKCIYFNIFTFDTIFVLIRSHNIVRNSLTLLSIIRLFLTRRLKKKPLLAEGKCTFKLANQNFPQVLNKLVYFMSLYKLSVGGTVLKYSIPYNLPAVGLGTRFSS